MISKISPVLKFKIIVVFVNALTTDYEYPVPACENLGFPIQMQLSQKLKTFSQFFVPFMESKSNFKHLQIKEARHRSYIFQITDCQTLG